MAGNQGADSVRAYGPTARFSMTRRGRRRAALALGVGATLSLMLVAGAPVHAAGTDVSGTEAATQARLGPAGVVDLTAGPTQASAGDAAMAARPHGATSVQVNDPNLDNIQDFPPQRPFEFSTQSETSAAAFGDNVVVGFNNSADQPIVATANGLAFVHRFLSAVAVSHDGGQTWTESSLPPIPGSPFTFGDPSVTVDRQGNFYYASLGANAAGASLVFVSRSTDGGSTFQPGVTVAIDPGSDKEWIAAGPDPLHPERDDIYVTWTSFKAASSQLMLGRSTDGGQTWTTSTVFAPQDNGVESAFIQFSNPVVDPATGRLYVPFLHGGDTDADYLKVLISDDGGQTFRFSNFNAPGLADPTALPVVTPGTLTDCGTNGGFRTVLHSGPNLGGGRLGLPRYEDATRLVTQPMTAALNGTVAIAYNASNSPIFGDPASTSEIRMVFSRDGGNTWQGPSTVAAATSAEPQHVHPTISLRPSGQAFIADIGYYAQLANGQLQVDAASTHIVPTEPPTPVKVTQLSPPFDLTPSNIPIPTAADPRLTTNYDRTLRPCYDIGEYMSATQTGKHTSLFAWGDNRNQWTSPADSPAAGTHAQPDVFAAVN